MEILFVDNKDEEFDSFFKLPFAKKYKDKIHHTKNPVGLSKIIEENPELRLIILDILWESDQIGEALELGAAAMLDLNLNAKDVPVVIYSILDDEETLKRLVPEMIRLGAYDWISKDENLIVRSFKFERAFELGRNKAKFPASRAILPIDQQRRADVHVAVMFCDLSGFTALSHDINSNDLLNIIESFYSLVGSAVQKHNGYIDKYIGDAVMVVFGAIGPPLENSSLFYTHVRQALSAAREIQAQAQLFHLQQVEPVLKKANLRRTSEKVAEIGKYRIGIESGLVDIVRFARGNESEITFLGTPVNIAARILNQGAAGEIWLGENAMSNGGDHSLIESDVDTEYKNLPGTYKRYKLRG